ncbi:MAG: sensor histidine kinase [Paracoccaceae bacterium]
MSKSQLVDVGAVFDAGPIAQVALAPDLRVVAVNRRYCEMTGRSPEQLLGNNVFDVFKANPDDPEADNEAAQRASVEKVLATGDVDEMPIVQHDVQDGDGRYVVRYWRLTTSPIFADAANPQKATHALVSAEEVTQDILGRQVSEAKRRAAARTKDLTYFEFDPEAQTLVRTPQLDAMFGFGLHDVDDSVEPFFERVHPDDLAALKAEIERVARTVGADLHHDFRVVWTDGTTRHLIGRGESTRDPSTQTLRIVGVLLDVTEIRENEVRLREAVDLRDMLIAEVNHRVKNSLQMVTSILSMEMRQTQSADAKASFNAAIARVRAISAIHASLYDDDDVETVQIDTYLHRMAEHLRTSLGADKRNVRLDIEAAPLRLPTDKAISLSLAVNELVTNSFKHAFTTSGQGRVVVRLRQTGENLIELEVSDDGTTDPLNHSSANKTSSGLGQNLIAGMANQLNGKLEQDFDNGWRTRITFPR